MKYKTEADIIKATSARKLIGLPGNCHKVDAQLFVMGYHKLGTRGQRQKLKLEIDKVRRQYRKSRHKIKYHLNKLSKSLEKDTGLSNDEADAVVLAQAGWVKYGGFGAAGAVVCGCASSYFAGKGRRRCWGWAGLPRGRQ